MENRFTFTRAKLQSLPIPKRGDAVFYDEIVRSLCLRISQTGARSFRIYRKLKGLPTKITLGAFDPDIPETRELPNDTKPLDLLGHSPSLNVRMARKLATAVNAQLDTGANPGRERRLARNAFTLGNLFEQYHAYLEDERKKTLPAWRWTFERYLGELPNEPRKKHGKERTKAPGAVNWQNRALETITQEEVSRLRHELGKRVGKTTANHVIELVRAMFNFAKKKKLFAENPANGIDKFKTASRERFVRSDEVQKFFAVLESVETDPDFRDYVLLSVYTGARRGNVLAMRWDELSADGSRWALAGEVTKNGEPLVIPLIPEATEILRRRQQSSASEWVFPGGTPAGHMGTPRNQWERFVETAKLSDLRIHDMRRTLGAWMAGTGANTVLTMRALGHKTINAALVYQRLELAPVRDAMQQAVGAMLKTAAKNPPNSQGKRTKRLTTIEGTARLVPAGRRR